MAEPWPEEPLQLGRQQARWRRWLRPTLPAPTLRRFRPQLDCLEERCLPSATLGYLQINIASDVPAQASVVEESSGKRMALVVFLVVFALGLLAILGWPRLVTAWRNSEVEELPADVRHPAQADQQPAQTVVHIASGRPGKAVASARRCAARRSMSLPGPEVDSISP